jgi:hypothetical protein
VGEEAEVDLKTEVVADFSRPLFKILTTDPSATAADAGSRQTRSKSQGVGVRRVSRGSAAAAEDDEEEEQQQQQEVATAVKEETSKKRFLSPEKSARLSGADKSSTMANDGKKLKPPPRSPQPPSWKCRKAAAVGEEAEVDLKNLEGLVETHRRESETRKRSSSSASPCS